MLLRWLRGGEPVLVLAPLWMAEVLAAEVRTVAVVHTSRRRQAERARARAAKKGHAFDIVLASEEMPFAPGSVSTLVVDDVMGLTLTDGVRWLASLAPCLRSGGHLISLDVVKNHAAQARIAGTFLSAAMIGLVQEHPREDVVLTVATSPAAAVREARFAALPPAAEAISTVTS